MKQVKVKNRIGYFCSFVPVKLLESYGFEMIHLSEKNLTELPENPNMLNTLCSVALKSAYVIEEYGLDGVIFTNCCNSMQRAYDFLVHQGKKAYMLDIVREQNSSNEDYYNSIIHKILKQTCQDFDIRENCDDQIFRLDYSIPERRSEESEKSIVVLGNIVTQKVQELIHQICSPLNVKIKSCNRVLEERIEEDGITLYREPCVHNFDYGQWLSEYLKRNKDSISGIIFITSPYCDVSLFQYPKVKKEVTKYDIPVICLENSYSFSGTGQLLTRLEAFMEGIHNKDIYSYSTTGVSDFKVPLQSTLFQRMRYVNVLTGKMDYKFLDMIVAYQMDLVLNKLRQERDKIVWTNMVMPVELFYSMGLIPVHVELIAGWMTSLGLSKDYIVAAESKQISNTVCSYHKAIIGLLDSDESLHPKTMVMASTICDGGMAMAEYCREKYETNVFRIQVPFEKNEDTIQYVRDQYRRLSTWLKEQTSAHYSEEKFKEALQLSNLTRREWIEAGKLRKYAQDFDGRLVLRNLFGVTFLFGSETGYQVVKEYKRTLKSLQKKGKWPENRKRILWIHFSPLYRNEFMEYMEKELGLILTADAVSYIYWDEYELKDCFRDISERLLSHFYIGDEQRRKKIYADMIEENQIDGVIHFIHRGCRTIGGSAWLVRELAEEKNIPYMELSGDCIDSRGNASQQDYTRLEAFKERLEGV